MRARFLRVHRLVAVCVGPFEDELYAIEIFVFGERLVPVGIGDLPIRFGNAASERLARSRMPSRLTSSLSKTAFAFNQVDRSVVVSSVR